LPEPVNAASQSVVLEIDPEGCAHPGDRPGQGDRATPKVVTEHLELMIPGEIRNCVDVGEVRAEFVGELLRREIRMAPGLSGLLAVFL